MARRTTRKSRRSSRFFFYSHDGLGLGHIRRNLSIARALVSLDPGASVLLATSADEVERFGMPPRVDVLKLPGLRKLENERYASRRLPVTWGEVRSLRASLLETAVEGFRPDVLLADKHPLGVGRELEPALLEAREGGTRTVIGFRDILDAPAVVRAEWSKHRLFEQIPRLYDRVLVYGQPDVFDARREYGFPDELVALTRFCGYVVAPTAAATAPHAEGPPPLRRERPRVLASTGGGEDGFELLSTFIEAAAEANWDAEVVSGPQCGPQQLRRLRASAAGAGVTVRRFAPGLASELRSLDALVCMGGYNTLAEAVASEVPIVCVPRVEPRQEQLVRARAFARRGLLRLVEPGRVESGMLRSEVEAALGTAEELRRRESDGLDLTGARQAAVHVCRLAHEAHPTAQPVPQLARVG